MVCNALSLLRPSPIFLRPWSVIWPQLLESQQTHLTKITYLPKLRLMDFKVLSLLRLSPRLLRPWSVILKQLLESQLIHLTKFTYHPKLILMDCNASSLLRLSPRVFRSSSPKKFQLLSLEIYVFSFPPNDIHILHQNPPSSPLFLKM